MKFKITSLVLLFVFIFTIPVFAANNCPSSNQICATSISLNKLTIKVDISNDATNLEWGDGSSVVLPKGYGQSASHDYAYNPAGLKTYTLKLGGANAATFTIDDTGNGQSNFNVNQPNGNGQGSSASNPYGNEWKMDNVVILSIDTTIHERAGLHFKVINFVQNSLWLAKIVGGPRNVDDYTWWKIQLANGQTGWVIQSNPVSPFF